MKVINWIKALFANQKKEEFYSPRYDEVMISMSYEEARKVFIAYEVRIGNYSDLQNKCAIRFLESVARSHKWNMHAFLNIIEEEYDTIYKH